MYFPSLPKCFTASAFYHMSYGSYSAQNSYYSINRSHNYTKNDENLEGLKFGEFGEFCCFHALNFIHQSHKLVLQWPWTVVL